MIEVTDEMVHLVYERIDFVNHGDDGIREGLAAVLAIVERDQAAAVTPSRWRCNRTERCFREDGHDGRHAFAGEVKL